MSIETFEINHWNNGFTPEIQNKAINALESGKVVYMPNLAFDLLPHEKVLLNPEVCSAARKNVCYDLKKDRLSGQNNAYTQVADLQSMMRRYALQGNQLLKNLFPEYAEHAIHARTSYRPVEIAGRVPASYRKDDTRLHVDAFPSTPTQGNRILRVFSNVNPHGQPRVWRVGEAFDNVVHKFVPQIKPPMIGSAKLQKLFKITRSLRTLYDHYMLNMHNDMKFDQHYQKNVTQQEMHFPPGSTWFVYTDQVSHAAMAGQYLFEQTFYLPVANQHNPETSPLRVLERFLQKNLV